MSVMNTSEQYFKRLMTYDGWIPLYIGGILSIQRSYGVSKQAYPSLSNVAQVADLQIYKFWMRLSNVPTKMSDILKKCLSKLIQRS